MRNQNKRIVVKMLTRGKENIPLENHRKFPCHYLTCTVCNLEFLEIEYKAGNSFDLNEFLKEHVKAFESKAKKKVVQWDIIEQNKELL